MLERLESDYNCANASSDLPNLLQQLSELELERGNARSAEQQEEINRLENQIRFIRNKCDIPHES